MKSVAEKMGIKESMISFIVDAPPDALDRIQLPAIKRKRSLTGEFDYIHLFVKTQAKFRVKFPALKKHLKATGSLWVSWPKSGQIETDLTLPVVIKLGYDAGLVESKTLSVDSVWSAIKFTHPKAGKKYNNSYGKLPV
ncbi:MAG: hypothetical protein H7Y31_16900 [Chitinophagaceae bacterium]|nr:hypothetical protein [Chitinophagaceae bacterium]